MPVSLPGFASYNDFINLFFPLKNEQNKYFYSQRTFTLDESCFCTKEAPETLVPFTEDCRRSVQQMVCQYADLKQKQFILQVLLKGLPVLPVELINAAYSLYNAIIHKENIDIAVLNTLGLATSHLLAEGNIISQLAQFARETIIDWAGEGFINQFLNIDENSPNGSLFTALAITAITLKYWMRAPLAPQRRFLQLPPYLANLVIRISNYWQQIDSMAQHATAHCQLPAASAGKDYLCIQENVPHQQPKGLVLLERDAWSCAEAPARQLNDWKPLDTCQFSLSAATLQQVREEGVVASRRALSPDGTEQPVSSGSSDKSLAAALVLPTVASLGWRGAGQAALGTSVVALMGYAWYSMFGSQKPHDLTQEQADLSDIFDDNERTVLENWLLNTIATQSENHTRLPISEYGFTKADHEVYESEEEVHTAELLSPPVGKVKRETGQETLSRRDYWSRREQQLATGSAEIPLLALLKSGPQAHQNFSLAAPRESFPLADAWFTRMDQLAIETFSPPFQEKLLAASRAISTDRALFPPEASLPVATWLHLGKYYELFYKKILHDWAKILLRMDNKQSVEYAYAARNTGSIIKNLNSDWNNNAIEPSALRELIKQNNNLQKRHIQLSVFTAHENERIGEALKNQTTWPDQGIAFNEFLWDNYPIPWLDSIDMSKFTNDYKSIIKSFIDSTILSWEGNSDVINVVNFYAGTSILTAGRIRDGLKNNNIAQTYNYAVLDEQLRHIIRENISGSWRIKEQNKYLSDYNKIVFELVPLWWRKKEQLDNNRIREKTNVPILPLPANETTTDLKWINWRYVRNKAKAAGALPTERFNAEVYTQQKLKAALEETVDNMIYIAKREILNPEQFIESWIKTTLKYYSQNDKYNSASLFNVDFPRHPDEEIKSFDGFGGKNRPPRVYSLQQIVRGIHREYDQKYNTKSRIFWPDSFSSSLRERLENGISGEIDKHIDSLFIDDRQALRDLYRIMIRKSAFNYLARKNAIQSSDDYHDIFANAMAMFLQGKIEAQIVRWFGVPLSGVIFIPANKAVLGGLNGLQIGVFLSVWDNDYYEATWPGFVRTILAGKEEIKTRNKLVIESQKEFHDFMSRYRTTRAGRNLEQVNNAFGYHYTDSMHGTKNLIAPFTFITPPASELTERLISLYHEDIKDLYDTAIFSDAELTRSIIYERLNALSIVSGVLLMGATLIIGGPAWVWVLASIATSLFLDIVPHAVLYSQADSDDEREVYIQAMVMAVAIEVGTNIVSEVAGPLIKTAARRLTRLGSTAFRTTLPQWFQFTKTKLEDTLTRNGLRKLKRPATKPSTLSKESRHDLDEMIRKFDNLPANNGAFEPIAGSSGTYVAHGMGRITDFLFQQERLYDIKQALELLKFKTRYRVITEWEDIKYNLIRNRYTVVGERETDRVVINIVTHGKDYSCIYVPEDEWLRDMIKKGERNDLLITYADFDLPDQIARKNLALAEEKSSISPANYPKHGRHIYVPQAWQEKMTSFKFKYEDIQKVLDNIDVEPLSKSIREGIESNPNLQSELSKIPRLDPPPMGKSGNEAIDKAMIRAHYLRNTGTDIEKFYPLSKWMPLMDAPEAYISKWDKLVTDFLENSKDMKIVKNNFILLKEAGGAGIVNLSQIAKIESEFLQLHSTAEKLAVLLMQAKNNPMIRENILITLARFVNSTNPRILGESYQRLDVLAERLYKIANYHVVEQQLARVVPMTPFTPMTMQAFVLAQDPAARIMILLPKLMQQADIASLLMHEMSHLATHSDDFSYLNQLTTGFTKLPEHHASFGQYALEKESAYAALGQKQLFIDAWKPKDFTPLTELDRALAQARVREHPMLGAYVKMNNADSLVILVNALMEQFDYSHNGQVAKGVVDERTWSINLASSKTGRKKRSTRSDEDIYYHQFREDVLAAMFYQILGSAQE
ncbi:hypothetical protein [Vagococcus sp. WN89Y]|uniref:hypothetical protein n=1 Tax=Vagococcus sp. WN89Y TaxID=3457258 RepID=UPI003FCE4183